MRIAMHSFRLLISLWDMYAAETWRLKAKILAKLNSTEMDFLATLGSTLQEGQN
jgi:hypothetical protein